MRILLVDDEPDVRSIARLSLERVGGHEVVEATSGRDALSALPGSGFDVVLLDVMMPDLDGPATLAELRAHDPELPVVFLTAKTQTSDRERLRGIGAVGVIAKPFDPMRLPEQLSAILER